MVQEMAAAPSVPASPLVSVGKGLDWSPLAVLVLALSTRLALIPWFRPLRPFGDESYYWTQATRPFFSNQFRPPLWPLFLKPVRLLWDDPFAGRLLAATLGALATVLVFVLARRLFGKRTAWAAAVILSFYPDHVVWSHFLWSEMLFTVTILVSCLFFFSPDREAPPRLLHAALPAGVSLLSKEFAVIVFAAMVVAHLSSASSAKLKTLFLAILLFAAPMSAYLGGVGLATGRFDVPFGALMRNARSASRISTDDARPGAVAITPRAQEQDGDLAGNAGQNLARLWGAQSYSLWRISRGHYGSPSRSLLLPMLVVHGLVLVAGLLGLVCEKRSPFAVFAWACIVFLSLSAVPGFLVSRFRTPFLFLFVIEGARLLASPASAAAALRSRVRCAVALAAVAGLIALFVATYPAIGVWG